MVPYVRFIFVFLPHIIATKNNKHITVKNIRGFMFTMVLYCMNIFQKILTKTLMLLSFIITSIVTLTYTIRLVELLITFINYNRNKLDYNSMSNCHVVDVYRPPVASSAQQFKNLSDGAKWKTTKLWKNIVLITHFLLFKQWNWL